MEFAVAVVTVILLFFEAGQVLCQSASKSLGDSCASDDECQPAYSYCNLVCICKEGFLGDGNGLCAPTKVTCPYSSPDTDQSQSPQACTRKVSSLKSKSNGLLFSVTDSCSSDTSYCQLDTPVDIDFTGSGYCCPKPSRSCPVGQADLTATCNAYPVYSSYISGVVGFGNTPAGNTACDEDSHYCYPVVAGNQVLDFLCCPRNCKASEVGVGNKCYPKAQVGGSCSVDDQCSINAQCQSSKCQCSSGFVLVQTGECVAPVCNNGIQPLVDASSGTTTRCDSSACPSTYYCTPDTHLCCPTPAPTCRSKSGAITTLSGTGKSCSLYKDDNQQCEDTEACNQWYVYFDGPNNATAVSGLCCPA